MYKEVLVLFDQVLFAPICVCQVGEATETAGEHAMFTQAARLAFHLIGDWTLEPSENAVATTVGDFAEGNPTYASEAGAPRGPSPTVRHDDAGSRARGHGDAEGWSNRRLQQIYKRENPQTTPRTLH